MRVLVACVFLGWLYAGPALAQDPLRPRIGETRQEYEARVRAHEAHQRGDAVAPAALPEVRAMKPQPAERPPPAPPPPPASQWSTASELQYRLARADADEELSHHAAKPQFTYCVNREMPGFAARKQRVEASIVEGRAISQQVEPVPVAASQAIYDLHRYYVRSVASCIAAHAPVIYVVPRR